MLFIAARRCPPWDRGAGSRMGGGGRSAAGPDGDAALRFDNCA